MVNEKEIIDIKYDGISIQIEKDSFHIITDEALDKFLHGRKWASYMLVDYMLQEYRKNFNREIEITRKSLACEIRMHFVMYKIAVGLPSVLQKTGLVKRVILSTEIIDCGERSCDHNRWCWDFLSHFIWEPKRTDRC